MGSFLRRRLVAGHAVVNVAFLGLAEIENAASTLAVNEDGGLRVRAFPFCFGSAVLTFVEHAFRVAVRLPCGSLPNRQNNFWPGECVRHPGNNDALLFTAL